MTSFGFRVYGIPAPQGSKIPGVSSKSGKLFVREQSGKTLAPWREAVKRAALIARGVDPDVATLEPPEGAKPTITGPVVVTYDFFVPRPASVSATKRPYPSVAPDLDKYVRGAGDALREGGVYADDSQIVGIRATKRYADGDQDAGAWITIAEVPPGGKLI
jgi:crossover junction endodeoxyribonuclease RusA